MTVRVAPDRGSTLHLRGRGGRQGRLTQGPDTAAVQAGCLGPVPIRCGPVPSYSAVLLPTCFLPLHTSI